MLGAPQHYLAVIKVVGVGGGGCNAVNRMIDAGLKGVEFIAINTDAQSLLLSDADVKLDIGRQLTRGLGAGSDPEIGRQAAEEHRARDRRGAEGRRHGVHHRGQGRRHRHRRRAASSRRSRKQIGALTIGVVTRPFGFEGRRRSVQAESGIQKLKEKVDTIIIIPNERLLQVSDEHTSMLNAFKMADEVLLQGVQGITDLITTPGLINTDFADVKMILTSAGSALHGRRLRVGRRPRGHRGARRDLEPAARGEHRRRARHPAQRERSVRPRAVRAQRGGRDHRPGRAPRRQHHLRRGHRRRARRRGAHHGDRGRLRPLRGRSSAPGAPTASRRSVSTTRTRSPATTRSTSATTTSTSPSSCAEPPRPCSSRPRSGPARGLVQRPARRRLGAAVRLVQRRRPRRRRPRRGRRATAQRVAAAAGLARPERLGVDATRCTASRVHVATRPTGVDAARRRRGGHRDARACRSRSSPPTARRSSLACDDAVGVVHAGHRGLARGVIDAAVERAARDRQRRRARVPRSVHPRRALRVRRRRPRADSSRASDPRSSARTRDGHARARHPRRGARRARGVRASTSSTTAASAPPTRPSYFSYRRDGATGRQVTVAVLPMTEPSPSGRRRLARCATASRPRRTRRGPRAGRGHARRGVEGGRRRRGRAAALAAAQLDFGENRAQELRGQGRGARRRRPTRPGLALHRTAAAQQGAGARAARRAAGTRSTGSSSARELARHAPGRAGARAGRTWPASRRRVAARPADAPALVDRLARPSACVVDGLMTVPPAGGDPRPHFAALRELARRGSDCPTLSMGMSGDFEAAIAEGATIVRVGSAVFGPRREGGGLRR